MSWLGVLEHHARAHARQAASPSSGTTSSPIRGWRDWAAALAAGLHARGVGAGDVVGLLSYNSIEFLATIFAANHLGAIAMPINWRLAAAELRFILEHSEARALVCDDALLDLAERGDRAISSATSCACASAPEQHAGLGALRRARASRPLARVRAQVARRRHPPADVHVGHHRAPEGRHAHARQPGVEELRAHHRVRVHRRRRRPRVRAAVPRRRARPRHHDDDRGRVRPRSSTACSTRQRVVDEIERSRVTCGVDRARDGPGDPRRSRHRASATCRRCG